MPGKLSFLILFFFVITGCSAVRNNTGKVIIKDDETGIEIVNQIPFKSLMIPRAQIEIDINGRRETLSATIRYNEDNWLLTLRSEDGIEIARAFISKDTLLVNDRLNRKLYYGSSVNLRSSYGFGQEDLSLIFGVLQMNLLISRKSDCNGSQMHMEGNSDGSDVSIDYSCNTLLPERISMTYKGTNGGLIIEYMKYKTYNNIKLPSVIEVKLPEERMELVIRINTHQINDIVNTDFIPGNNYEKVLIR